jgi:hypothetical protein
MKFGYGNMGIGRGAGEEMCVTCGVVCRRGGIGTAVTLVISGGLCWTPLCSESVGALPFPFHQFYVSTQNIKSSAPQRPALMVVGANDHLSQLLNC